MQNFIYLKQKRYQHQTFLYQVVEQPNKKGLITQKEFNTPINNDRVKETKKYFDKL
jgi:hypothetical protein